MQMVLRDQLTTENDGKWKFFGFSGWFTPKMLPAIYWISLEEKLASLHIGSDGPFNSNFHFIPLVP